MRGNAKLVIVGAGIVGCSAAYHLTQKGWRDIVVVDRGPLFHTGGSTSHAPGLVFQTNGSKMMTEFAMYTVELLNKLDTFYPVGGIEVAYSPERWEELKRKHGWATSYGLEAQLITPEQVKEHVPILNPEVIHGGYYVPSDGDARTVDAAAGMAEYAKTVGGAKFYGETTVTDIEVQHGRVKAVMTDKGRIETEHVLLCTNIWGPVLADKIGVNLPLLATEHQYVITMPIKELAGETREIVHPILRQQDGALYFRQHKDAYGIGSYQHEPLLVNPYDLEETAMNPFTPEHFEAAWQATIELLPALKNTEWVTKFNGMFAFTADGFPIMGPAAHIEGMWAAIGVWVTHSGGVGKAIAEWMTDGVPSLDVSAADISRFHKHVFSKAYIYARCATQYDEVYDIIHPNQQMENPRNLRLAPFQKRLVEQDAVFFESSGWEHPQWYEANKALLKDYDIPQRTGWEAQYWSPIQGAEHLATRERVALFDLAPFTKIEVSGTDALQYLNYLSANNIDQPVGKVVYTALLDQAGGIKADLTITRLAEDRFWMLTGGGMGPRDLAWVRAHVPDNERVQISDVSSQYTTVGLWGPLARDVLASVAEEDVSNETFSYYTAQWITIGPVPALALRVSYAGELGWEIYARQEYGLKLWDLLWEAGRPHGIIAAGGGAFDSLRLEKGYRLWGAELNTEYNPYEAGLGWAAKLDKGAFIGRDALQRIKDEGITRKLCCMTLDDPGAVVLGKEPIMAGNTWLGYVTSANMGYNVGKYIVYGYLPLEYAQAGTQVDVVYFNKRYTVTVSADPLFDPENKRLKT